MIDLENFLSNIAIQHKELFPNATLESQIWKLEEEFKEHEAAENCEQEEKEAADVVIVCAGIYRWCPTIATYIADFFIDPVVADAVTHKWQINMSRKWEWNGKTYKHVGKDGNE